MEETTTTARVGDIAGGEKTKARDILSAIRTLRRIEEEGRKATPDEPAALARFAGFGPVALSIFPDPVTGRYRDAGWQVLRRAQIAPHAGGIRFGQTHHLQRLLYIAHGDRGDARGTYPPWRCG